MIVRPKIASQEAYRLTEDLKIEPLTIQQLLDLRDLLVNHFHPYEGDVLEIDFEPFYDYSPKIRDPKNIGKGVQFLSRYLSSKLFDNSPPVASIPLQLFETAQLQPHPIID